MGKKRKTDFNFNEYSENQKKCFDQMMGEEGEPDEKQNPIKSVKLICTSSASPEEYTIYAEFRNSRVDIEIGSITVDNKKIIVRCTYGGKKAIILDTYYNVDGEFADEQERINFKQHVCDFITEYIKNEFC